MIASLMLSMGLAVVGRAPVMAAACAAPTSDLGTLTMSVSIPNDGDYTVWTRMEVTTASANSVNLEIDGTNCYSVGGGSFAATSWGNDSSNWVQYANGTPSTPVAQPLTAGNHTLKYIGTQDGVSIDKIIVTGDNSCTPTGDGTNCDNNGGTGQFGAPTNVHTTLVTSNSVSLGWDVVTGASSYVIFRDGQQVGTSGTATYSDSSLTANTTYSYTVKAQDANGTLSDASTAVSATTVDGTGGGGGGGGGGGTGDSIYVDPATGTYAPGSTITVAVRENSGTDSVNAAQADMTYSSNLEFQAIDATTSDFGIDAAKSGGSGAVSIARGTTTAVTGDKLIANVTFKVLAEGTGTITMGDTSQVLSADTNNDVLGQRNGGTYTLAVATTPPTPTPPTPTPPTPTPPTPTPPTPTPPSGGGGGRTGGGGGTGSGGGSSSLPTGTQGLGTTTSITPTGSTDAVTVPDNSTVELSDPATVTTDSSSNSDIKKVEYYLNNKLIATVTQPPFSYAVNTKQLRNGTYKLTTKTYYENGKTETNTVSLVVKNPMNATQIMLQLKHYAWLLILLFLIIAGAIWFMFFRGRGGSDDYGDDTFGTIAPTGTPPYDGGAGGDPNAGQGGGVPPAAPPTYGNPYAPQ